MGEVAKHDEVLQSINALEDDIVDQKEANDISKTVERITKKEINLEWFFETNKNYPVFLNTIISNIDTYLKSSTIPHPGIKELKISNSNLKIPQVAIPENKIREDVKTFLNTLKAEKVASEKKQQTPEKNNNKIENSSKAKTELGKKIDGINKPEYKKLQDVLNEKNTSLWEIMEKWWEKLKNGIRGQIIEKLRGFEKMRWNWANGLNELWNNILKKVDEALDPWENRRLNNIFFCLYWKIIEWMNKKLSTGNKELDIENKVRILTTLNSIWDIQGDFSKIDWNTWAKIQEIANNEFNETYSEIIKIKNWFTNYLAKNLPSEKDLIDEASYKDENNKDAGKYKIKALHVWAIKENIPNVIGKKFNAMLEPFDNYGNTTAFIATLLKWEKRVVKENNTEKTKVETPSEKDIENTIKNTQNLLENMPLDKKSEEYTQFKEKVMNQKADKIFGKLEGILWLVEWIFWAGKAEKILNFLRWNALWKKSLSAFTKWLDLSDKEQNKLLNRPFVKKSADNYIQLLRDEKNTDDKIIIAEKDKEEIIKNSKIDYYRNSQNIVISLKKDSNSKFTWIEYSSVDKDWQSLKSNQGTEAYKNEAEEATNTITDKETQNKTIMINHIIEDIRGNSIKEVLKNHSYGFDVDAKNKTLYQEIVNEVIDDKINDKVIIESLKDILQNNYICSTHDVISALINEYSEDIKWSIQNWIKVKEEEKKAKSTTGATVTPPPVTPTPVAPKKQ